MHFISEYEKAGSLSMMEEVGESFRSVISDSVTPYLVEENSRHIGAVTAAKSDSYVSDTAFSRQKLLSRCHWCGIIQKKPILRPTLHDAACSVYKDREREPDENMNPPCRGS